VSAADISAAMAASRGKGSVSSAAIAAAGASKALKDTATVDAEKDDDVEDEGAIINDVSGAARTKIAEALSRQDEDAEVDSDEIDPPRRGNKGVPTVKAKVDILDRSQHFGFVSPPADSMDNPPRLAHFWQGGKYYDANGERVRMPGDEENDAKRVAELARTRKQRAVRLRREAEMLESGVEPETPDEDVVAADVNLTQWVLYQRSYRFAEVRKAIHVRYNRIIPTEDEARNFLIDEGVVTEDQVRTAARVAMEGLGRSRIG
jgi:hypothetical protein